MPCAVAATNTNPRTRNSHTRVTMFETRSAARGFRVVGLLQDISNNDAETASREAISNETV